MKNWLRFIILTKWIIFILTKLKFIIIINQIIKSTTQLLITTQVINLNLTIIPIIGMFSNIKIIKINQFLFNPNLSKTHMQIIILTKNPFLTKKYNNKSNLLKITKFIYNKITKFVNNCQKSHSQELLPFKVKKLCKSNLYRVKLNHNNLQILNKIT